MTKVHPSWRHCKYTVASHRDVVARERRPSGCLLFARHWCRTVSSPLRSRRCTLRTSTVSHTISKKLLAPSLAKKKTKEKKERKNHVSNRSKTCFLDFFPAFSSFFRHAHDTLPQSRTRLKVSVNPEPEPCITRGKPCLGRIRYFPAWAIHSQKQ